MCFLVKVWFPVQNEFWLSANLPIDCPVHFKNHFYCLIGNLLSKMFAENYLEFSGMVYDSVFNVLICCQPQAGYPFVHQHNSFFVVVSFSATACISYHIQNRLSTTFFIYFFCLLNINRLNLYHSDSGCLFSSDSLYIILPISTFVNNFFILFNFYSL